jgi:hypothetical protein
MTLNEELEVIDRKLAELEGRRVDIIVLMQQRLKDEGIGGKNSNVL